MSGRIQVKVDPLESIRVSIDPRDLPCKLVFGMWPPVDRLACFGGLERITDDELAEVRDFISLSSFSEYATRVCAFADRLARVAEKASNP